MDILELPVVLNVSDIVWSVSLGLVVLLWLTSRLGNNVKLDKVKNVEYMSGGCVMTDEEVLDLRSWIKEQREQEEERLRNPHTAYHLHMAIDEIVKAKCGEIWIDGKKVIEHGDNGEIRVVDTFKFNPSDRDNFTVVPNTGIKIEG